jgi:hypothetical protein
LRAGAGSAADAMERRARTAADLAPSWASRFLKLAYRREWAEAEELVEESIILGVPLDVEALNPSDEPLTPIGASIKDTTPLSLFVALQGLGHNIHVEAYGRSLLGVALQNGREDIARRLLDAGISLTTTADCPPLDAIRDSLAHMVDELVALGADVNGGSYKPLWQAANERRWRVLHALLDAGADARLPSGASRSQTASDLLRWDAEAAMRKREGARREQNWDVLDAYEALLAEEEAGDVGVAERRLAHAVRWTWRRRRYAVVGVWV